MVLLTSAFLPPSWTKVTEHVFEIYAAVNTNLLNKFFVEVHILTESSCADLKHALILHANKMPDAYDIIRHMDRKLTCRSTDDRTQPSYADFFRYANQTLSGRIVLFSNADVVFDDTLGLVEPGPLRRHEHGYVLSVRPPPHGGAYQRVFHRECDNTPRCAVGKWQGGGSWGQTFAGCSWDSYIFSPPLSSSMNLTHIDIIMNMKGAENVAGYQLEVGAKINLHNPCFHVHAWHWHCLGGKMHSEDNHVRADHPYWLMMELGLPPNWPYDAVDNLFPCWNCPGISRPKADDGAYCKHGTLLDNKTFTHLNDVFRTKHVNSGICCQDPHSCRELEVERLPHCSKAEDVNCVIWESLSKHHYY
jgi:hypothetical protein